MVNCESAYAAAIRAAFEAGADWAYEEEGHYQRGPKPAPDVDAYVAEHGSSVAFWRLVHDEAEGRAG